MDLSKNVTIDKDRVFIYADRSPVWKLRWYLGKEMHLTGWGPNEHMHYTFGLN